MMNRFELLILAATALATLSASGQAPRGGEWTVYLRRVGPVRFGMSIAEAEQVLGARFDSADRSGCGYVHPSTGPAGLSFMVEDGRIVRVDVDTTGVRTTSGAEVGKSEAEIEALYPGRIRTEPHKYTEGHYLVYTPRDAVDRRYRLIFETDGKVVTSFRSGLLPAVEYVEGCA